MDAGYCLYVHITVSHLNHLILTILINSCQTSGFRKVGAIIKHNIMHFPVLIKTVLYDGDVLLFVCLLLSRSLRGSTWRLVGTIRIVSDTLA